MRAMAQRSFKPTAGDIVFWESQRAAKLDLRLPALRQGALPEPPSVRIMAIANMRAWAYGLMVANLFLWLGAVLWFFVMMSRIEIAPFVADGSSYGCRASTFRGQETPSPQPAPEIRSEQPIFAPLSPMVTGE